MSRTARVAGVKCQEEFVDKKQQLKKKCKGGINETSMRIIFKAMS